MFVNMCARKHLPSLGVDVYFMQERVVSLVKTHSGSVYESNSAEKVGSLITDDNFTVFDSDSENTVLAYGVQYALDDVPLLKQWLIQQEITI